ncbi:hypothetical protein METHB2_80036 [Candidatus Methylobacter favarea]|uniref:Cyclic nucleotide-binding domain-containing protein n=1 Tax=Candidatus Methylobacter favarea TaxID=2707345 RepID=A0A8S0Y718_9GAMM|nr:hypothetical protein [Candidatus Methylobacter favarea]CAA9892719.1 hypothetical protein METHB2_80036 [Candidatus Methylobacter favarea]
MTVQESRGEVLFKKGNTDTDLVYLLKGEVILKAEGLIGEVISAGSEPARFALAHKISRKIDAIAKRIVRFLRLDADIVNSPPPFVIKRTTRIWSLKSLKPIRMTG